jgi:hypothetical protein
VSISNPLSRQAHVSTGATSLRRAATLLPIPKQLRPEAANRPREASAPSPVVGMR